MWRVFGDALGFTGPGRFALAGFLEIALMVSAIRARRSLRETGSVGVDGAAVWGMAALSAVLAASDAEGLARAVRFAAPLVAAWLWERGMAADRRAARVRRTRDPVAWRLTVARVAVWLRLADPVHREVTAVDQHRRLAKLTRARLRLAVLESSTLPAWLQRVTLLPVRLAWATWRLQRHALSAVEHLHLGTDPTVTAKITTTVAAVVGLREATTPERLSLSDPWQPEPTVKAIEPPAGEPAQEPARRVASLTEARKTHQVTARAPKRPDVTHLMQAGREVAADLTSRNETVTWNALWRRLRDMPVGCSAMEAKELRRKLREPTSDD
jgi:hypothetical protein